MILVTCAMASSLCYALQFFVQSPAPLIVMRALAGLAMGGILSSLSASLARLAPSGQEGVVYGANATVVSIANAFGPILGGAMGDEKLWGWAFIPAGIACLVAAGIATLLKPPQVHAAKDS